MTCFMCKGTMYDGVSSFIVDLGSCIVIVKNVPSSVCGQCSEVSYSDEVARRLEEIVCNVRNTPAAEIAVFNYPRKAA